MHVLEAEQGHIKMHVLEAEQGYMGMKADTG